MKLNELLKSINIASKDETEVTGITEDSRKVIQGNIFIAYLGTTRDGINYIEDATKNGAIYILSHQDFENFNQIVFTLTAIFYNLKKEKVKLIAVTGTNGKTTTTTILYQTLRNAGYNAMLIGTNGVYFDETYTEVSNTTPSNIELIKHISYASNHDINFVILEASSHALDQNRLYGLEFDYLIYLNLGADHLDYHQNLHSYLEAKRKILNYQKENTIVLVNGDDNYYQNFLVKNRTFLFGLNNSYIPVENIKLELNKSKFNISDILFEIPFIGLFNIYNTLPTILILLTLGIRLDNIAALLQKTKPPIGRMELIYNNKFQVYLDFAHTEQALENVLKTIKEISSNRLICLFGCGGNRDKGKRAKMGEVACKYSDKVVVTSDNPRFEDPQAIIEDILKGCDLNKVEVIISRAEAIKRVIEIAKPKDIILLCGKGHEEYQIIKDQKIKFSERELIYESLNNIYKDN